jgi:hypothetical protein
VNIDVQDVELLSRELKKKYNPTILQQDNGAHLVIAAPRDEKKLETKQVMVDIQDMIKLVSKQQKNANCYEFT